jgi:hypothetical protein
MTALFEEISDIIFEFYSINLGIDLCARLSSLVRIFPSEVRSLSVPSSLCPDLKSRGVSSSVGRTRAKRVPVTAQCGAGFFSRAAMQLRFKRCHREKLQIQGRRIRIDPENVRADPEPAAGFTGTRDAPLRAQNLGGT